MKKAMLVLVLMCCFVLSRVEATVYFRDGLTHDVGYGISDGRVNVNNNIWGEPTTLNLLEGGWILFLYAYDNSVINILGGEIGAYLAAVNDSSINMTGGLIRGDVSIYHNATFVLSNGTIKGQVWTSAGEFELRGDGIVESLWVSNNAKATIYGGQVEDYLRVDRLAFVTVVGTDFFLDGRSVADSFRNPFDQTAYAHFTGTYLDGSTFGMTLQLGPGASISFIPEPATLLMLGAGMLFVVRKRQKGMNDTSLPPT